MPTHSGPNTLGESNLVFAYDTGDIENSYKGEPTVNLIDSVNFTSDIASWNAQENVIITRNQLNPIGVIDNSCLKIHPNSGSDNYMGVRGVKFASSGTNHTFSFWAKGNKVYNNFPINFGVYQVQRYINITKDWQYFTVQTGAGVTFTDHTIHFGGWGTWTDTAFDLYLWHPQLELKSHATPFTTGTRSATQGLLDLTGTSSIDLSNVSFDSNAQMVFDGTDDYIQIGQSSQFNITTDVSAFAMVKINDLSGWDGIFGTFDGGGFIHFQLYLGGLNCYIYGPDIGYDRIDSAQCYLTPNQWTEVGFTFGANTLTLYINGVAMPTKVYGSANLVSSTSAVSIGRVYAADRCFGGNISDVRLYNRALTQAEISQNYLLKNLRERN
jgi:hypothetical protein